MCLRSPVLVTAVAEMCDVRLSKAAHNRASSQRRKKVEAPFNPFNGFKRSRWNAVLV
jgi:hypothetical protein